MYRVVKGKVPCTVWSKFLHRVIKYTHQGTMCEFDANRVTPPLEYEVLLRRY